MSRPIRAQGAVAVAALLTLIAAPAAWGQVVVFNQPLAADAQPTTGLTLSFEDAACDFQLTGSVTTLTGLSIFLTDLTGGGSLAGYSGTLSWGLFNNTAGGPGSSIAFGTVTNQTL